MFEQTLSKKPIDLVDGNKIGKFGEDFWFRG